MQWVMNYYKKIKIIPKVGYVNLSDYAAIHNTFRKKIVVQEYQLIRQFLLEIIILIKID